jgi:Tfp pilus assembly PilM family ATPase
MKKSFFDFFPTPKFLEMPAPGMALTDSGITFIELSSHPEGLQIERYGSSALPQGLIVGGVIKDQEHFVHALENFRKSFKLQHIRTSFPEERAYLFQTTVPDVNMNDLRGAVEATIEENVPLSVAEVVFDYNVLPHTELTPQGKINVSVSVIPETVVLEYLSAFRAAGFIPLHFDVESQAVTKALIPPNDVGVSLIINLNTTKAGIYIVSDSAVTFSSTITISPPTKPRQRSSQTQNKNEKLAQKDIVAECPSLPVLVQEIKKVFLYWQAQADRRNERPRTIERIIVCGDEGGRSGITGYIGNETGLRTELGNVWRNVCSFEHYVPKIPLAESLAYAGAIGLALPHQDVS